MQIAIIIPSRYHSTRLPGKPLVLIKGKSLLYRVWHIANQIKNIHAISIATDDERIAEHAHQFGAHVIMTPAHCKNGTERVFAASLALPFQPDVVLNFQGDAVLTPPWVIQALVDTMSDDSTVGMATIATQLNQPQYDEMRLAKVQGQVGGTLVVMDKNDYALYFSKSMVPFVREISTDALPVYRHIGLYVYRYEILKRYLNLQATPLEKAEGLEQLRALENNIPIKVVKVDYRGRTHWAIDSMEDVKMVERIIEKEGELIS